MSYLKIQFVLSPSPRNGLLILPFVMFLILTQANSGDSLPDYKKKKNDADKNMFKL